MSTSRASVTSSAMPSALATAAASSTERNTISCSSATRMISNERRSVTAEMAPSATLPSSFFHLSRLMSALALVGRPCRVKASAMAVARADRPPAISPMVVGRSPKLRTTPGASTRPACAVRPPITFCAPRTLAERLLIAEAVLEADGDRLAGEQVLCRLGGALVDEGLALKQHDISRLDGAGIGGGLDRNGAIAADADDAQALGGDG